ncbi:MAG: AgmX/PglI C-terminal domain-containing protein [Cryobacterium sp.]|nr:AgmX/PglI C-terminal domain-containing protein [Oligoflexia bacterium]
MNNRSYLVKISAGTSDSSRVWNPRKPMIVGHPMRWLVSKVESGVEVTSLHSSTKHFVKNAEIEKVAEILLAKGEKDAGGLKLQLRLVGSVPSAHAAPASGGSSLRIFYCKADWTIESAELTSKYVARIEGNKVFQLKGNVSGVYAPTDTVELEALTDGVAFAGANIRRGEKRLVRFCDASNSVIAFGGSEWKLAPFSKDTSSSPFATGMIADADAKLFEKTLKGALAATLVAGLLAWFMPAPELEAKKEEPVKILLAKKKVVKGFMTAAPTGDPRAHDFSVGKNGSAKSAGKKGTAVAHSKKVAPAGERHAETRVASHAPAKAVAKSAAKSAAKPHSVKVAAAKPAAKAGSKTVAHSKSTSRAHTVAVARPVPVPHSELFKTFSSSTLRKATAGLLAGGGASGARSASDSAAEARSVGNSGGGSGRSALGGTGGVSTRSASVSGFGGGGLGNGDGGPGSSGAGYGRGSNSKVSGQGRSLVSMDTGASDVDEGLTREQVARVVNAHMNEIRYCYDSAKLRASDLSGTVKMKFSIGAPGDVQTASVGSSTVGNRDLHDCLAGRIKNWRFPKPKGGVTVATTFPFMFKSLSTR